MQLSAFTADHFPLGQAAMQVNEGLPAFIVSALERRYGGLNGKTVGILGMAFKSESDDPRASLSYKLRKLLSWAGARVLATDPYVVDDRLVDPGVRHRGERHPHPRGAAQGIPRPPGRRQGRRRRVGQPSARGSGCSADPGHRRGRVHQRLPGARAADAGHEVVGLDDFSKYGRLVKSYDEHPRYRFVEGDAKDTALVTQLRPTATRSSPPRR